MSFPYHFRSVMNDILALLVGEDWIERVDEIRWEMTMYLSENFKEPELDRSLLDGVHFWYMSQVNVKILSSFFSLTRNRSGDLFV